MAVARDKYTLGNTDFCNIRNRNEGRVVAVLGEYMQKQGSPLISEKDLYDIYALALNALPPRYAQQGTIILRDPVHKQEIRDAVEEAWAMVMAKPKD